MKKYLILLLVLAACKQARQIEIKKVNGKIVIYEPYETNISIGEGIICQGHNDTINKIIELTIAPVRDTLLISDWGENDIYYCPSGPSERGGRKLYLANSGTANLIYGDFNTKSDNR